MSHLQAKDLAKLQGVPVENRQDEILAYIRELQLNSSSQSAEEISLLKRVFKVSNKPLMLAYLKNNSATSFHEENERMSTTTSIFSRRKLPAPAPIHDGALSFINNLGQSTSTENPAPQEMPLPGVKAANHKFSVSVYWNKLFNRQKNKSNVEEPKQEPKPETEKVQELKLQMEPETQSLNNIEKPSLSATQKHPPPVDPKPECSKPETPMRSYQIPVRTESVVSWKRWLPRRKSQLKNEAPEQRTIAGNKTEDVPMQELKKVQNDPKTKSANDVKEPPLGGSQEQQLPIEPLPIEPLPEHLETKPARNDDYLSVAAEQEDAKSNLPASNEVIVRSKPQMPTKSSARKVSEEPILNSSELDQLPVVAGSEDMKNSQPTSDDVNLPIVPKPDRSKPDHLKPQTPKRSVRSLPGEQILSPFEPHRLSVAAEPENVEPIKSTSDEVNLSTNLEPEPKTPKRSASNESGKRTLSEYNHLSVAAEPEDVKPNQPAFESPEPEDAKPNLPASNEVNLPINLEPELLKPQTPTKSSVRNLPGEQILSSVGLSVAGEPEDVESNLPASDDINTPIAPKPKTPKKRSARCMLDEHTLSICNHLSIEVEPDDAASTPAPMSFK